MLFFLHLSECDPSTILIACLIKKFRKNMRHAMNTDTYGVALVPNIIDDSRTVRSGVVEEPHAF
jgi:hypothetical protein